MPCNIVSPSTVVGIVEGKINQISDYASSAFSSASALTEDLSDLTIDFSTVFSTFNVPGGLGTSFSYQEPPDDPEIEVNFNQFDRPLLPSLRSIDDPVFRSVPELDASKPVITFPEDPTLTTPTEPGTAPTLTDITLPTAPDAASLLPSVPTLEDITLPTAPTLDLPTFTATGPNQVPMSPGETFSFTEETFSDALFTKVENKISTWLDGGTGLPDAIWTSIWDRAREKEDISSKRAVKEAEVRWSSRGFSYPPGALNATLQEINQNTQNKEGELAREIAIKQSEMEQNNLQFAIQQGVALENLTITLFNERATRAFEASKFAFQATIDIFNAQITLYNAQLEAYKTDADVYRTRIEAELSRLEVYKAELEGQKLLGDLNQQEIDLYNAQLQSVLTHIEIYKGELAGVTAQVELDKAQVEAFIAKVRAYAEEHNANAVQVQSFAEQVKAQTAKSDVYKTEVDAFAAEINAYAAETDLEKVRKDIEFKFVDYELQRYIAQVQSYREELTAEIERIKAGVNIYDGQARIYASEIAQEEARVRADADQRRIAIEEGRIEAEMDLKAAEINVENLLRTLTLELERLKTLASVQGNLAASALDALDVGANLSGFNNDNFNYDCT